MVSKSCIIVCDRGYKINCLLWFLNKVVVNGKFDC